MLSKQISNFFAQKKAVFSFGVAKRGFSKKVATRAVIWTCANPIYRISIPANDISFLENSSNFQGFLPI
jgi:hypothetical protein